MPTIDELITAAHTRQEARRIAHEADELRQLNAQIARWTADFKNTLLNALGSDVVAALGARYVTGETSLASIRARFRYAGEVFELSYSQGLFELERRDDVAFDAELNPVEPTADHAWFKRISFYGPDGGYIVDDAERVDVVLAAIAELAAHPHEPNTD